LAEPERVVSIELSVEAGDWPPEEALRDLSERAIGAAVAVLDAQDRWSHALRGQSPSGKEGDTGATNPFWNARSSPHSPHPEVRSEAEPRRTRASPARSGGSFEARLRLAPQDEVESFGNGTPAPLELSLLFTDDAAIRRLNAHYRGQDKPTNVLSFPQAPGPHSGALLGDVILAVETVRGEAALAGKPFEDHMAHLLIHGFLHLLGYDHETDGAAEAMEALERSALETIGIADPTAAAQSE